MKNTLKALWANALLWLIRPALEELDRRKAEAERLFNAEHKKYWDKVNARRTEERRKEQAARVPEFASPAERRAFRAAAAAEEANLQGESRRFYDSFPVLPASQFNTSPINQSK